MTAATGRYIEFLPDFYASCRRFFLPDVPKHFFVMTDASCGCDADLTVVPTEHRPWPYSTLLRFRYVSELGARLHPYSHVIALDVDTRVCSEIGRDLFFGHDKPLFGVQHPGFVWKRGSFETDVRSTAAVGTRDNLSTYWAGGMWGGKVAHVLYLATELSRRIDDDLSRGVIAVWHDESHLNKFFIENRSQVHRFDPGFMYPESWRLPYKKRILALDKNHDAMRQRVQVR